LKPVYAEADEGDCVAAWLERPAGRVPLKRIDDHLVEIAALPGAPHGHAAIALVETARAALPDQRTREIIALVARTMAAVGPVMGAVERVGPAARIGMPTLPPLPRLPALPSVAIGPRPLSLDELQELERVGLGLPSFPAIA
jgi:hypothetical protein